MAAITSTVLAIGGAAYKGFSAIDAAKSQSREAGRLTDQADELERNALADIEQNRLEAVQAPMQIFDTANELQTLDGSTILEAAAEGDSRGVQATAGKIKATQDAARTEARDSIAKIQTDLELQVAKEGNRKGELASEYKTDQAIEMSLEADAMQKNADELQAAGTANLVEAGVGAFSAVNSAFGSKAGKLADKLMEGDSALSKTDALAQANTQINDAMSADSSLSKGQAYRSIKKDMSGGQSGFFAGVGGALKNAFSTVKNTTADLFSEENMASVAKLAKDAGLSIKEFIAQLNKK